MSQGLRYKWHGSHISILRNYDADSPSHAITSVTNADPAVVTSAAHGLEDGDVIYITGVVGMIELNARAFIVDVVTSSMFSLHGVDSTNYATYTSGGLFDVGVWSEFCELTSWARTGASKTQIDATSICSDATEYEVGLPGQGTVAINYNFAELTSTAQVALRAWDDSGDMMGVKVQLPGNGGTITRLGFVQQLNDAAANGAIWTGSGTILLTGKAFYQVAA
jgi:Ubiquitin-activating enzyme E1 FCCH domain/Phage tail tube protein, TTP